ncbi:MAG TPA: DNA helicase RecG, partial [Acidimicrobiia bacterium]|nr:DNA helicase RecG [Acidimicrobiia bacterium]
MPPPRTLRSLDRTPLDTIGVSAKLRDKLALMGIETVLDLLQHYPRRYHDRTKRAEIAELAVGEEATVFAEVQRISSRRIRQRLAIVDAVVSDGTSSLNIVFFNQPWREKQLAEGTEAAFFGKLDQFRGKRQLTNPVVDVLAKLGENTGVIVPLYPQSGKAELLTWQLRPIVAAALDWAGELSEPLSDDIRTESKVPGRTESYRKIHQP